MNEEKIVKRNFLTNLLAVAILALAVTGSYLFMAHTDATSKAYAADPVSGAITAQAGAGGVTSGLFVKFSADGVVIKAAAATDAIVGVCEQTAALNAQTKYAPPGTRTVVTSGAAFTRGALLTSDANGKAVAVNTATATNHRAAAVALISATGADESIPVLVLASYVNTYPSYAAGSNTVAAAALAIPVTKAVVVKATGAGAEALTLANGTPGQVLVITLGTDGGGDGTLTPATATTWATIVFADAGDTAALLYIDDTVGWVILGLSGLSAPPAFTV
jgi:hypothetical protein